MNVNIAIANTGILLNNWFETSIVDVVFVPLDSPVWRINSVLKEMRENPYLLPVLLAEAFALPELVERATQKPHAEYVNMPTTRTLVLASGVICISTRHLPVAASLTNSEICEVSTSQERAQSKRFPLCLSTLPRCPCPGFRDAAYNHEFRNKKQYLQCLIQKF